MSPSTSLRRLLVGLALAISAAATGTSGATAETGTRTAATPDHPLYDVSLRSDATGDRWTGRQRVSFRNASAQPLREVYVRLWGNGPDGCAAPAVKVSKVRGGTPAAPTVGCTALRIKLPAPLTQGHRATVSFDVDITVPDRTDRFGREGAFRFLGNALPVLAVHDATGWHLDPYASSLESFYTLAGDFQVTLDHPTALKVPATGRTTSEPSAAPGRTLTRSVARKVRDFAWAAGPFRTTAETTPGGIRVRSYWSPDTPAEGVRINRRDGATAVDALGASLGRYPYGELDLVMTPGFPGGMEYPGLVLLGTTEEGGAAVHEIAHQWWYGIVGNDEYRSPWLDESFAQYSSFRLLGILEEQCSYGTTWPDDEAALTNSMAYFSTHPGSFRVLYSLGPCALWDLEKTIGSDAMDGLLRNYARDHWYGVSTTAAFKRAAQSVTSKDLGPFWETHRIR
ncbi:M1 family metallopeptidase [Streptomyces sp. NPDC050145]|uniref:M1 family metallopeptidase n=1 Tax=Streptomyces sp. NPDC050145 TaxID=3365602 RepID=UPI0037B519CB